MTINISEELANVDARLIEIEPIVLSAHRFAQINENRKRKFTSDVAFYKKDKSDVHEDAGHGGSDKEDEIDSKRRVSSIVVPPPSSSESREKKIQQLEKNAGRQEKARNRRLFSNLLGALENRHKDASASRQAEKIQEVERKLAEAKDMQIQKAREEKERRIQKGKEAEEEMNRLKRKKALLQYAGQKIAHYELLKNAIQTTAKPVIFFTPSKHNVRSLELLKTSQENINHLIEMRKAHLENELNRPTTKERRGIEKEPRYARGRSPAKPVNAFKTERNRNRSRSYSRSDDENEYKREEPDVEEQIPVPVVVISDEKVYRGDPTPANDNDEK